MRSLARRCLRAVPPAHDWLNARRARGEASRIDPDRPETIPLLVYQMGKVGSSTVVRSLRACPEVVRPVIPLHFLVPRQIEAAQAFRRRASGSRRVPYMHRLGAALGPRIAEIGERARIPVISLVRDPIARELSTVFQTSDLFRAALTDESGQIDVESALAFMAGRFAGPDPCGYAEQWFDRELRVSFGVDVFAQPFDDERGFSILRTPRADVLLLRTEDLDRTLPAAAAELLSLDAEPEVLRDNERALSADADAYAHVQKYFRLPRSVVECIYSGRLTRHFYGEERIAGFIERWSGP